MLLINIGDVGLLKEYEDIPSLEFATKILSSQSIFVDTEVPCVNILPTIEKGELVSVIMIFPEVSLIYK